MRRFHRILVVAVLAAALATGAGAVAPGDADEPKTLLQHLNAELERVRLQIQNAGARLKGGAVSMGTPSGDAPMTPARGCCEPNILRIRELLGELSAVWGELRECYRAAGDAEAEIQANFVREDATSLIRALGVFADSPAEAGAVGGYQAMVRAYRHVAESAGELVECGEPTVRGQSQ